MADQTQAPSPARGVYAALATPRRRNSIEADTAALLDYLDVVASAGVDGLVLFGSTGEFVHFGIDERMRAAALAIKRSRLPVLVNASHSTLAGAVAIAENAVDSGASGLLLAPPHFYRYGDDQLFEFYLQFNERVGQDSPVYLYNLPMFLNPISPQLAGRLLKTGAFAGIKDSSGEPDYFDSLNALRQPTSFQLLLGNEAIYLRGRSAGADGAVSGVAAAIPELIVALDRAITGGEEQLALRLDKRLHEFLHYVDKFPATVAIRQAASVRGWKLNHLAIPFDDNTAAEVIAFHRWFREWLAEVLPECAQPALMRTRKYVEPNKGMPDEFRRAAYAHADWIADLFEHVREYPVLPSVQPGEFAAKFPQCAPEHGDTFDEILRDFGSIVFPALTLWNHPRFFAWFSISSTPPSILAEFLTAAVNVNAMLWKASPAATELEQVTLSWIRQWLGLDDSQFGIIYDTASIAVMQAIGAAREYIDPECRTKGMRPGLTIYVSEQTHFSAEKAAITLGFGQENVRKIGVDKEFRMRPDLLAEAIEADLVAGKRPCCIVASVGSTSTSAIDPIPAIAEIASEHDIWLHVDAAYGGSAAVLPEMRHIFAGVERAHSLVINPHKWLYVSIDCSILYTTRPEILRRASSLSAEVIRTAEDDHVVNFNEYGVQLGRRFRALKLWYVLRYYGRQAISAMLRESLRLAQILKQLIEEDPCFELAAPVPFSLVCFCHRGDNAANERLLAEVNRSGKAFLSHTVLNGQFVLRCAIGNFQTTEADVRETWDLIRHTAAIAKA